MAYKDPRKDETIGGGYFVFRRHRGSKRVSPARKPFEHATIEAARREATALAHAHPGNQFDVLHVIDSAAVAAIEAKDAE